MRGHGEAASRHSARRHAASDPARRPRHRLGHAAPTCRPGRPRAGVRRAAAARRSQRQDRRTSAGVSAASAAAGRDSAEVGDRETGRARAPTVPRSRSGRLSGAGASRARRAAGTDESDPCAGFGCHRNQRIRRQTSCPGGIGDYTMRFARQCPAIFSSYRPVPTRARRRGPPRPSRPRPSQRRRLKRRRPSPAFRTTVADVGRQLTACSYDPPDRQITYLHTVATDWKSRPRGSACDRQRLWNVEAPYCSSIRECLEHPRNQLNQS